MSKAYVAVAALLLAGLGISKIMTAPVRAKVIAAPQGQDAQNIALIRQAGHEGDRSQLPMIISALRTVPHPNYAFACIHALAQIEAIEDLPEVERYIPQTITDPQERARTKMNKFMGETGLGAAQLNNAPGPKERGAAPSKTLYALRELADMIYYKRDLSLAAYAQTRGINFGFRQDLPFTSLDAGFKAQNDGTSNLIDTPAALKVGLAPLSDTERINWLVNTLSSVQTEYDDTYYAIQLAIDCGLPASDAAVAKLKEMQASSRQYLSPGFDALFQIVAGVGDKRQAPFIAQFMASKDPALASDAGNSYRRLVSASPPTYRVGY